MLVSICIPTFNRPLLVQEAVGSCFQQDHRRLEIFIGDDSLDDRTQDLLSPMRAPDGITLHYCRNRPGHGQARNVDALIGAATGEKLVLLHDDDTLLPGAVSSLLRCFLRDPGLVAAYGKQQLVATDGTVLHEESRRLNEAYFRASEYAGKRLSSIEAALVQQFPNDGFMVDAAAARRAGYLKAAAAGPLDWCDFAFGLALSREGEFHFLDAFTANYRMTAGAISTQQYSLRGAYEMVDTVVTPAEALWAKELALKRVAPKAIRYEARYGSWQKALAFYLSQRQRLSRTGLVSLSFIILAALARQFPRATSR
jgi:glycosyltransferase involved in cell wall biosynthesis